MSEASNKPAGSNALQQPVPSWFGAGLIGLVIGAGGMLIVMRSYAPAPDTEPAIEVGLPTEGVPSAPPAPGGAGAMGGGMMGTGMGGGGFGGGGGGARGKRNLSSLVGKLELLTRGSLHVELSPEQTAKMAEMLVDLEQAEKMTAEDAQAQLEALEAILTPQQKTIADRDHFGMYA